MGIFSHCKFSGEHFAYSLFVKWFVPFLVFSDLWKSTLIHKEFHILVKSELKLQTLAGALSQVRIIVRKPRVFIWVPPKADSETKIWVQGFGKWSQETGKESEGNETKKVRKSPKSVLMSRWPLWATKAPSCWGPHKMLHRPPEAKGLGLYPPTPFHPL